MARRLYRPSVDSPAIYRAFQWLRHAENSTAAGSTAWGGQSTVDEAAVASAPPQFHGGAKTTGGAEELPARRARGRDGGPSLGNATSSATLPCLASSGGLSRLVLASICWNFVWCGSVSLCLPGDALASLLSRSSPAHAPQSLHPRRKEKSKYRKTRTYTFFSQSVRLIATNEGEQSP